MSTQPSSDFQVPLDANGNPIESWGGKFERKFKENPFVPVRKSPLLARDLPVSSFPCSLHSDSARYTVAGLTTASLIIAGAKLRKRESTSLNTWLRVRVVMQGLTIVAVVGGSWWYGQMKHQKEAAAAVEQERILERAAFESRLRAAEDADRLEKLEMEVAAKNAAVSKGSSGWSSGWWGKGSG